MAMVCSSSRWSIDAPVDTGGLVLPIRYHLGAGPDLIARLAIDSGIGAFSRYLCRQRQKDVLLDIAGSPDGHVSLAVVDGAIVGYLLLCEPGPAERWGDSTGIYELSFETSRNWRRHGIANSLLSQVLADPVWLGRVLVAQGYHWIWDVEQTGLSVFEYRDMFCRLFRRHGFTEFETDDPEIRLETANILTARVGSSCPSGIRRLFYADLYRGKRPDWLKSLMLAA